LPEIRGKRPSRGKGEQSRPYQVGPWLRGVNYAKPASELGVDELFATQNTVIGNAGQCADRKGSDPYITTAMNSNATITAVGKQKFTAASERVFAIAGDKFYEDASGTWTDRSGGLTITAGNDNVWSLVNAGGTLIGNNGVSGDALIKWTAAGGNIAAWDVDSRFTWAKHVEYWDRRAWAGNTSSGVDRVWRSDAGDIETFEATAFYQFGEDVTGLRRFNNDMLAVHTNESIFLLVPTGDATTPYRKFNVLQDSAKPDEGAMGGAVSGRSIVNLPNGTQVFVRREGVFAFNGGPQLIKISKKLDGSRYWDDIVKDELNTCFAVHYAAKEQVWFCIPHGSGTTTMNHIMVYDYGLSILTQDHVWYGPFTGTSQNAGALIDDLPHMGDYNGFVMKHDTANVDDDGSTENGIDAYFETAAAAPTGGADEVEWLRARHFYEVTGNHSVEVQQQSAGIPAEVQDLNMGGSYDAIGTTFAIGVSAIAGDNVVEFKDTKLMGSDPFTKMRYRNGNGNEPFSIRRIILFAKPLGRKPQYTAGVN